MLQSGKRWIIVAAAALAGSAGMASAADEPSVRKVWVADYAGRPPFKRRPLTAEVADERGRDGVATARPRGDSGERVWVVKAQGRPPFERRLVEVDAISAVEFARFEEVEKPGERRRRVGPPGKGRW